MVPVGDGGQAVGKVAGVTKLPTKADTKIGKEYG
jgi:hypothetical protein